MSESANKSSKTVALNVPAYGTRIQGNYVWNEKTKTVDTFLEITFPTGEKYKFTNCNLLGIDPGRSGVTCMVWEGDFQEIPH